MLNLEGVAFGRLVAKERKRDKGGSYAWMCMCSCGKEVSVTVSHLRDGHTKSCGCLRSDHRKMSDITKEKLSRAAIVRRDRLGYVNSPETRVKIGIASSLRVASPETRRKMSESLRGSNCHFWQGGITRLSASIRRSYKYRLWRQNIFIRDDYSCRECGVRGGVLNVDHKKTFSEIFHRNNISSVEEALNCSEFWDIENGRTLCRSCHKKTDTYPKNLLKIKNKL
jgi:5-methylcytosine-specific restriction endonuclease McrA